MVPCVILVTTPCDNLTNSFSKEFVLIYFSCPVTFPLNNCVYPHGFPYLGAIHGLCIHCLHSLIFCLMHTCWEILNGVSFLFSFWTYSPWWILVWNNMWGIFDFNIIYPWRWYGLFRSFFSTLGGRVSTLRGYVSTFGGSVVCYFTGSLSFSFGGEKISADAYNASIWGYPTLLNGVRDIVLLYVSIC